MNEITTLRFESWQMRMLEVDRAYWWMAADVVRALGLTNSRMVLELINDEDKCKFNLHLPGQPAWWVNETGLLAIIVGSRKQKAREFTRWFIHEGLPAINRPSVAVNHAEQITSHVPALPIEPEGVKLSGNALAIFRFLAFSGTTDWSVRKLMEGMRIGASKASNGINELIRLGYLTRRQGKSKKNAAHFGRMEYILHNPPLAMIEEVSS